MKPNRGFHCITASVALAAATVMMFVLSEGLTLSRSSADEPHVASSSRSDPKHLWNRIRSRLHIRIESQIAQASDEFVFDPNEHDPLYWSRIWFPEPVDYLLRGKSYREAIALLDEFLASEGQNLASDPMERALLQHDLWAVFDYVSDPEWSNPLQLQSEEKQYRVERRELSRRLAKAIKRLALTDEEIEKLPDNYAAAVASQKHPPEFNSEWAQQAFLPHDLWEPEGPWVLVGEWADNPLAIRHTAFFGGRSIFAVFLRLPGGRDTTAKYLKELREWKPKSGEAIPPNGHAMPPQVPPKTQFALIRRMMVVNKRGEIIPTHLTESIQIRVLPDPAKAGQDSQRFLEYRIRRQDLINGKAGGLYAVQIADRDRSDMLDLGPRNDEEKHEPILASCRTCHSDQGILSMNSYTGSMENVSRLKGIRSLTESSLKNQQDATIAWKQRQYTWGLLTGFKASNSPP